jgi:hypothetical protein
MEKDEPDQRHNKRYQEKGYPQKIKYHKALYIEWVRKNK